MSGRNSFDQLRAGMTPAQTEAVARNVAMRRELTLFALLAGLPTLAIAALFHVHPWPTPMPQQAAYLGWPLTAVYLALGAAGVAVLPWTAAALTPALTASSKWLQLTVISLGGGIVYGCFDLAINRWTAWGAHIAAVDQSNGLSTTFVNVRPPWSLAHYFHASVLSECAFRLVAILVPTWLVGRLLLKDRHPSATFWIFAVLAALIEPLEKAILLRNWGLLGESPMELAMNIEAIAWQLIFALLLRRFGWAAPILARFGYYLVVRAFTG